jgi:hypothetical protein
VDLLEVAAFGIFYNLKCKLQRKLSQRVFIQAIMVTEKIFAVVHSNSTALSLRKEEKKERGQPFIQF